MTNTKRDGTTCDVAGAQRADWAVSSPFWPDKKIPLVQACSLRRKSIENLKKALLIEYTLIVQVLS